MPHRLFRVILLTAPLAAQFLVVDRAVSPATPPTPQPIETRDNALLGDSFQVRAPGEIWMVDSIRVWAVRNPAPACTSPLGDQGEKLTLYGAMDNPPVPGQPECNCHARMALQRAPVEKGKDTFTAGGVKISSAGNLWQIDFQNVRWSIPGGLDALFPVRLSPRAGQPCPAAQTWSLSASPAAAGYRLRRLDQGLVPRGFADAAGSPRWFNVQVRAHRTAP